MRNLRMYLGILLLILTLPNMSFGQDQSTTTATVTTGSVAWHDPTSSGRISENLRLGVTANWGVISLNEVRRQRHDAQVLGGTASIDFRLLHNPSETALNMWLGAAFELSHADDSSGLSNHGGIRGVSVLDRTDVNGKIRLTLESTPEADYPSWAWKLQVATGAGFQSWNGDRPIWISTVDAEVSCNLLDSSYNPLGPYLGFHGSFGMGKYSSYQMDGRLALGLRGASDGVLSEWRLGLTTSGFMDEANRRKHYLLESNGHLVGFEVSLTLWNRLTLSVTGDLPVDWHIHERNREIPGRDVNSRENEQSGALKFGIGLNF